MALLSKNKSKKVTAIQANTSARMPAHLATRKHSNAVLLSPRVTEKAAIIADARGVYTFNVALNANKKEIAAAVKELFKVTPTKVRVVPTPSRAVASRRSRVIGYTARAKKAYVTLKKGDKIEFV